MNQRETRCDCVGCAVSDAATTISLDVANQRTEWAVKVLLDSTPLDGWEPCTRMAAEARVDWHRRKASEQPDWRGSVIIGSRTVYTMADGAVLTTPWTEEHQP